MPYIRRLPSGRYNAVVRLPNGQRRSRTDPLRKVVLEWALDLEADVRRGQWRDPRAGRVTLAQWHQRWRSSRVLAKRTLRLYDARWRLQIEPHLGGWPLDSLTSLQVQEWIGRLLADGASVRVVQQAAVTLSAVLSAATDARPSPLILVNPARLRDLQLPRSPVRPPRFLDRDSEFTPLLGELTGADRVLVDFGCHTGLRWGELAGLRGSRVDWLRGIVHVADVLDVDGRLREYPKGKWSDRSVPVPAHLRESLSRLMHGREMSEPLFTMPAGGWLHASNWRRRVWVPALSRVGVVYAPPHVMRHTAASWLVMAGVDLYRVQALLGHESYATTQRYSHLAPAANDVILAAWERNADPPVTHARGGRRRGGERTGA